MDKAKKEEEAKKVDKRIPQNERNKKKGPSGAAGIQLKKAFNKPSGDAENENKISVNIFNFSTINTGEFSPKQKSFYFGENSPI